MGSDLYMEYQALAPVFKELKRLKRVVGELRKEGKDSYWFAYNAAIDDVLRIIEDDDKAISNLEILA